MSFLNPSLAERRRTRLIVGGLSVAATALIAVGVLYQSRRAPPVPEAQIIYVDSWRGNRSRADALAARRDDAARLDQRLAASRAYIASLPPGEARAEAQAAYERYVAAAPAERDRDLTGRYRAPS